MTENEKRQMIDGQIAQVISCAEERIAKYSAEAAEDYIRFFHWNAGNMYQAHMERNFFRGIRGITKAGDMAEIARRFERHIEDIEHDLIETSPFGTYTNEVVNLEHRLELDGKRKIRHELQNLLFIARYKD